MRTEKFWLWLARRMPKPLQYWCTIVVGADATTQQGAGEVPAMTFMEVLERTEGYVKRKKPAGA